jgi:hypothetical protein
MSAKAHDIQDAIDICLRARGQKPVIESRLTKRGPFKNPLHCVVAEPNGEAVTGTFIEKRISQRRRAGEQGRQVAVYIFKRRVKWDEPRPKYPCVAVFRERVVIGIEGIDPDKKTNVRAGANKR